MISLILSSLTLLALPWALRVIINSVLASQDLAWLNRLCLGLLGLFAFQSLLIWSQSYLLTFVANRVIANLRLVVHHHLLLLPLSYFQARPLGEIIARATSDITVIQLALTHTPAGLLRQLIIFGGGLTMLIWLDWRLLLWLVVLLPLIGGIGFYLGQDLPDLSVMVQERSARLTATLEENLAGIREIKAFRRELDEQAHFGQVTESRFEALMYQNQARSRLIGVATFLGFALLVWLLWYGGWQVMAGQLTPGDLVAVIIYMGLLVAPIGEFAAQYSDIQTSLGASRRVYELMHLSPEPDGGVPLPLTRGQVEFKNLSFSYLPGQPVLQKINLTVPAGELVALVGPSGSGKTTLVNLLARFYELSAGQIEIDGYDISQVKLADLRRQIGLIPQETFLFDRSVRENIAYGRPEATIAEIVAAAQAACAHDFILALPTGYETHIGERGCALSAGQRQRLAIARLLLKEPRLLILDEATAALDPEAERWVEIALTQLRQGRTTFLITHHLSRLSLVDRIVMLKDGVIIEQGSLEQLLANNNLFARFYWAQPTPAARPTIST